MAERDGFSAALSPDGHRVSLVAGHFSATFNRFWLRDVCPELPAKESGMRTFSVATLPVDLRATAAQIDDDGSILIIDWSDDHRCQFKLDDLLRQADRAEGRRPGPISVRHFQAGDQPTRFVARDLVPGSPAHHDLLASVAADGLALVTELPDDDRATETLAALLGRIRDTDFGRVFNIVTEPAAWTLSQSSQGQDPHTDDPYRYAPSGVSILHCRRAAESRSEARSDGVGAGASLLVDGFKVADDLRRSDPEAFELLSSIPVPWVRHRVETADQGEDVHMIANAPVITVGPAGELNGIRFHERSTGIFDLDPDVVDRFYLAFRAFAAGVRSPDNQLVHRLSDGEAFVFDNQRVLHGRTGFGSDLRGRRHLRLCTVERDQVHSRLRRLKAIHGVAAVDQRLPSGAAPG